MAPTIDQLARLNSLSDPSSIYVGQRLLVPAPGSTPLSPQSVMHIVQPGETLESIAQLYGVDAAALLAQNQLADAASLYVGQLLDVTASAAAPPELPTDTALEPPVAASDSISGDVPEVALLPNQPSTIVVHTVEQGDTLFRIAKQYGVTVNELAQANHIDDPTLIYPGQELLIPGITPPQLALDYARVGGEPDRFAADLRRRRSGTHPSEDESSANHWRDVSRPYPP